MEECGPVQATRTRHITLRDRAGVGLKHLTGDIKKMLARIMSIDQNNYPEMLGHTCIINAPGVFKLVWSAIKGFIDPKTQEKIEVIFSKSRHALRPFISTSATQLQAALCRRNSDISRRSCIKVLAKGSIGVQMCPTNYTKVLLQWIEPENLPEYLGGTSKATLLDDAGPWQDPKIVAEVSCCSLTAECCLRG